VLDVRKHDARLAAMDALLFTDLAAAWEVAQQALHEIPDSTEVDAAATYRRAGSIRGWLDDPRGGVQLVELALEIHRSARPSVEHVRALHEHDTLLVALGRYEEAAASSARALEICAGLDEPALHRSLLIQQAFHDIDTETETDVDGALARLDEAGAMALPGPDPEGDIFLAIARTEVLRTAGRVGDEIVDAGRPGLDSAASWGIESFPAHVVRGNMSAALRLSGQVGRAAELIDPVISRAEPTHEDLPIHHERASLDMLRGRCAEALARFDAVTAMPTAVLSNRIEAAEDVASAELWCGRPRQALDHLLEVLQESVATAASAEVGADLALAARAAADVADALGATNATRSELREQLQRVYDQARTDPFARSGCFLARPAHGAAWAAEMARLTDVPSLELWRAATRHWDALGRPHDAAYCRWRGAQVALADGQGTVAAR
jgi:tetratricopeptide (TPR) repeat protein